MGVRAVVSDGPRGFYKHDPKLGDTTDSAVTNRKAYGSKIKLPDNLGKLLAAGSVGSALGKLR